MGGPHLRVSADADCQCTLLHSSCVGSYLAGWARGRSWVCPAVSLVLIKIIATISMAAFKCNMSNLLVNSTLEHDRSSPVKV